MMGLFIAKRFWLFVGHFSTKGSVARISTIGLKESGPRQCLYSWLSRISDQKNQTLGPEKQWSLTGDGRFRDSFNHMTP